MPILANLYFLVVNLVSYCGNRNPLNAYATHSVIKSLYFSLSLTIYKWYTYFCGVVYIQFMFHCLKGPLVFKGGYDTCTKNKDKTKNKETK